MKQLQALDDSATGVAGVAAPLPARSRSGLAVYSWVTLVARSVVTMLAAFIATPYLLRFLGAERLGAYRASQQWLSYVQFLYVGLTPALVVMLLRPASRDDLDGMAVVLKSGIRIAMRQSFTVVLPVAALVAWFMPELVGISPALHDELRWGCLISLFALFIVPLESFRSVLACRQLGYQVNIGLLVQSLVITGVSVWLAWLGFGLPGQYVGSLAGMMVFAALAMIFAWRHLAGHMRGRAAGIDRKELWSLRWPMLLTSVGGQMNLFTDYIVVSLIATPVAVTTFSITQRLMVVLGGFVTSFGEVSWAGLAELRVSNQPALFQARVLELVRLFLGIGFCFLVTFAAFNGRFVALWVGHQYYGGDALTILTAVQTIVVGYFMFFALMIDMAGDTRLRVPVALGGAVLNVILSVILGRWLGLYGVTLATVIAYAAGEGWYSPYLVSRRYAVSARAIVWESARAIAMAAPCAIAVWLIANRGTHADGWVRLGMEFSAASMITFIYAWFMIMRAQDRAAWRLRLNLFLQNRNYRESIG
ncbi:MAG TPA: polysaccharide biosynthesis C-terminal domain-containing protein [Candidatus Binataceae bacterium]|nr:polysaccharide biosynthesis C-terminal domain-containing protein [Candidatus Binataceae bacterium]